jgi:hypothetical protein
VDATRVEGDRIIKDLTEERQLKYYEDRRLQTCPIFYCHVTGTHANVDQEQGALQQLEVVRLNHVKKEGTGQGSKGRPARTAIREGGGPAERRRGAPPSRDPRPEVSSTSGVG